MAKSIKNGSSDEFATIDAKANTNYYIRIYTYSTYSSSKYLMRAKLYSWKDANTPIQEQHTSYTCGAANMCMVLGKFGINVSEEEVVKRSDQLISGSSYKDQTQHYVVLNDFLSRYGVSTRYSYHFVNNISEASYWSNVQKNINSGYPIITLCEYDDSGYFGTSSGHFITIRSYSPDAQRKQVRVNDSTPNTFGVKGIPLADLRDYTLYPNGRCHFTAPVWS